MRDISLEYELLIRRVFNCRRNEDPLKLGNADRYSAQLDLNLLRFSLSYALKKIEIDLNDFGSKYSEKIKILKTLDNSLWGYNKEELDKLMLEIHQILDKIPNYPERAI